MDETKGRLLQAAGEIIAVKGYQAATTREICARAGANIAAINYHFGDKLGLYATLLPWAVAEGLRRYPLDMDLPPDPTPEDRLRAFIRSLFHRLLGEGRPSWHGQLLIRELMDPQPQLAEVVATIFLPLWQHLLAIVTELLGPRADARLARHAALSVVAQGVHYFTARSIIDRLDPDLGQGQTGQDLIEDRADHVLRFSLAALRGLAATSDTVST